MPFIYKPIRQFMHPNEACIDPSENNVFSLKIGGQSCIAYRFQVYDLQNNIVAEASTERMKTYTRYDIKNVDISNNTINSTDKNLSVGTEIEFYTNGKLPTPIKTKTKYYIGNISNTKFSIYPTRDDAINDTSRIDITDIGEGDHYIIIYEPLYNNDILKIDLEKNKLVAGNTYKWQVDLYANDLDIVSVDLEKNTLNIKNHNLITGDTIFIDGDTLPTIMVEKPPEPPKDQATTATDPPKEPVFEEKSMEKYKIYYVRKIDNDNIALFNFIEGARNDAGRLDIKTAGTNVFISNVATSEQVIFLSYNNPILTLNTTDIYQQSFTFKPNYSHPQGILVNRFVAYLRLENNESSTINSGIQQTSKLQYTFDGLLPNNIYEVKFIVTNNINQVSETNWIKFPIKYSAPDLGILPTIRPDENNSSINMSWPKAIQINGVVTYGTIEYEDNFAIEGNTAGKLAVDSKLVFKDLNIQKGSSPPMFWWSPVNDKFSGSIMKCENTKTGDYIEIGYDGTKFYRIINGIKFENIEQKIRKEFLYMICATKSELIVNTVAKIGDDTI